MFSVGARYQDNSIATFELLKQDINREKRKGARRFSLVDFLTGPFRGKAEKPWSTDDVSHGLEAFVSRRRSY